MNIVNTRRLLCWSYQIARGVEFLVSQGVVHRDLALRNMLLTDSDVIKIADFGLAVRGMEGVPGHTEAQGFPQYWSNSNRPLPYKWMALECLQYNVFSAKSDIWSLGVCLWEIFSLAMEPYEDLCKVRKLYSNKPGNAGECGPWELLGRLKQGERLTPTEHAPKKVKELMNKCWKEIPDSRPDVVEVLNVLENYVKGGRRERYDSGFGTEAEGYVKMGDTESGSEGPLYSANYKVVTGHPVKYSYEESETIESPDDEETLEYVMVDSSDLRNLII